MVPLGLLRVFGGIWGVISVGNSADSCSCLNDVPGSLLRRGFAQLLPGIEQEPKAAEIRDVSRRKGTALAVPQYAEDNLGFSP